MQKVPPLVEKIVLYGILFSVLLVLFGGLLYLKNHGTEIVAFPTFPHDPSFSTSSPEIIRAAFALTPLALIQLGLLSLTIVQILRVAVIALFFVKSRDTIFALMCSLILGVLIYGLL